MSDRNTCHVASIVLLLVVLLVATTAVAGPLRVDSPVRAGGLWCLADSANPLTFRYLPSEARLAQREDGTPLFSLVYFSEASSDSPDNRSRGAADGGALLNFMVEYYTPRQRIARAGYALKQLVDPDAELVGPVVFDDGTYSLVSSTTENAVTRYSDGSAPVMPNGRVAISVRLDAHDARILDAALQAATPDLSLVFDMVYAGVRSSYDADIVIDWEKASRSLDEGIAAGISVYGIGVGGEIENAVTEMLSNGAISIEVHGEDASMDAIVAHIQEAATELFFTPLDNVDAADDFGSIGLPELPAAGAAANRYFSVNAQFKYKRKNISTTGHTLISLSREAAATRRWSIVFDAGEIAAHLVDDPDHVRTEDITDRSMSVRQIFVRPDLSLRDEFPSIARGVTVEVRKVHVDGRETFRQAHLNAEFIADGERRLITYPRFADEPWDEWLSYKYRSLWLLRGYPDYATPWQSTRAPEINVIAPFRRTTIYPIGQMQALRDRGVHAVVVEVRYPFLNQERSHSASAMTSDDGFDAFSVVVPSDHSAFEYTVTHIYDGGRRDSYALSDRAGFVPFDQKTATQE